MSLVSLGQTRNFECGVQVEAAFEGEGGGDIPSQQSLYLARRLC